MPLSAQKIVVVGIGTAGTVHVRALEDIPQVTVIAGVDISASSRLTFRENDVPVYPTLFDSLSEQRLHPDVVVVATPTPTHAKICGEVGDYYPDAIIMVEKPAADSLEDAERIISGVGGKQPVTVAYHMAFSPEVDWGVSETTKRARQLGLPVAVESWSADPYQLDLDSARARLGTSWIDSGINALSVIERFAKPVERIWLHQHGDRNKSSFEGMFACEASGQQLYATVLTSWYSTAPARSTRIRYSSGAELVMDHNAVAGYIKEDGSISAMFGSSGEVPRREAHYRALHKSWLVERNEIFSSQASIRLHKLLLEGQPSPG